MRKVIFRNIKTLFTGDIINKMTHRTDFTDLGQRKIFQNSSWWLLMNKRETGEDAYAKLETL